MNKSSSPPAPPHQPPSPSSPPSSMSITRISSSNSIVGSEDPPVRRVLRAREASDANSPVKSPPTTNGSERLDVENSAENLGPSSRVSPSPSRTGSSEVFAERSFMSSATSLSTKSPHGVTLFSDEELNTIIGRIRARRAARLGQSASDIPSALLSTPSLASFSDLSRVRESLSASMIAASPSNTSIPQPPPSPKTVTVATAVQTSPDLNSQPHVASPSSSSSSSSSSFKVATRTSATQDGPSQLFSPPPVPSVNESTQISPPRMVVSTTQTSPTSPPQNVTTTTTTTTMTQTPTSKLEPQRSLHNHDQQQQQSRSSGVVPVLSPFSDSSSSFLSSNSSQDELASPPPTMSSQDHSIAAAGGHHHHQQQQQQHLAPASPELSPRRTSIITSASIPTRAGRSATLGSANAPLSPSAARMEEPPHTARRVGPEHTFAGAQAADDRDEDGYLYSSPEQYPDDDGVDSPYTPHSDWQYSTPQKSGEWSEYSPGSVTPQEQDRAANVSGFPHQPVTPHQHLQQQQQHHQPQRHYSHDPIQQQAVADVSHSHFLQAPSADGNYDRENAHNYSNLATAGRPATANRFMHGGSPMSAVSGRSNTTAKLAALHGSLKSGAPLDKAALRETLDAIRSARTARYARQEVYGASPTQPKEEPSSAFRRSSSVESPASVVYGGRRRALTDASTRPATASTRSTGRSTGSRGSVVSAYSSGSMAEIWATSARRSRSVGSVAGRGHRPSPERMEAFRRAHSPSLARLRKTAMDRHETFGQETERHTSAARAFSAQHAAQQHVTPRDPRVSQAAALAGQPHVSSPTEPLSSRRISSARSSARSTAGRSPVRRLRISGPGGNRPPVQPPSPRSLARGSVMGKLCLGASTDANPGNLTSRSMASRSSSMSSSGPGVRAFHFWIENDRLCWARASATARKTSAASLAVKDIQELVVGALSPLATAFVAPTEIAQCGLAIVTRHTRVELVCRDNDEREAWVAGLIDAQVAALPSLRSQQGSR